jgi:hypothetical protein
LGPHSIKVNGEDTTVNQALGDLHNTFEEAKADVLGACWLLWTGRQSGGQSRLSFYVPGLIRSIRFGTSLAHGRANLLQFNYLVASKAIKTSPRGGPRTSEIALEEGLISLASKILNIQKNGDYQSAAKMWRNYGRHTAFTNGLIENLESLPIDINISFAPT